MFLEWTKHAIERVGERFGFKNKYKIPVDEILAIAEKKEVGDDFYFRNGCVVFVCRATETGAKVVTVMRFNKRIGCKFGL